MHRISTTPGDWNPQADGVAFFAQTPAPLVFLTATDTDIQTLAAAVTKLPIDFPTFRVANLLQLQQQIVIDTYAEDVLEKAQVIILRLLGGRSYWSYGLEVLRETARRTGTALIVIPGDDAIDPDLIAHSTVPLAVGDRLWRYFLEGGVENAVNALLFAADCCLHTSYNPQPPQVVPRVGLYGWKGVGSRESGVGKQSRGAEGQRGRRASTINRQQSTINSQLPITNYQLPKIGILFYRAHYLAGNTGVIDDLCQGLVARNLVPVPVFVSSLRDPEVQADVLSYFQPKDEAEIQVLLNTTSFSLARVSPTPDSRFPTPTNLWQQLDVPILQVIFSSSSISTWETSSQGLSPRDIGMNVALPEVDGRIISRAISFKAVQSWNAALETNVVVYESVRDRLEFIAELTQRWVQLRSRPPEARKIALILANYPNRDGRLANGVGLDTPASCVEILKSLQQAGYQVDNLPQTGDELIQRLTSGVTNDPDSQWRSHLQQLSWQEYQQYFATLPEVVQQEIVSRWGERGQGGQGEQGRTTTNYQLPIPGIQLGNVFVGIQPARGYDRDPALNYHAPDLEPTHNYLAFYYWIRQHFGADAIVHVGKHGNLEWLPGKSVALSSQCYPEIALGAMPHFYPFIVNDPGEGSQAKRRAQAVIIDHLTPPMTRAELYGSLHQLESLVDEYYEAQSLDPTRLPAISDRIWQLIVQENLHLDLGMELELGVGSRESGSRGVGEKRAEGAEGAGGEKISRTTFSPTTNNHQPLTINQLDGYLCELKEAQIRDGLHIFGQCPQGEQLRDLIVAIARQPNSYQVGFTRAIAQAWELDFDPLTADFSTQLSATNARILLAKTQKNCHTIGDAIEVLELYAAELVEELIGESEVGEKRAEGAEGAEGEVKIQNSKFKIQNSKFKIYLSPLASRLSPFTNYQLPITNTLNWIRDRLLPALAQTQQEITNLLHGLDGRYVPSGASGAPTRGRPEVLPTGRNFYSVDIRAVPTETAWEIGRKAAEALIERYTQENGEYPKTLGLSIWGTSTMRTGGDDIAEALALLGVRPVWDGVSRRVVDFEILPLSVLARPRVDVTLRISGFFRDAFPNLIDLFDSAVVAVSQLDEPPGQNPLAAKVKQETQFWQSAGLTPEQAQERSLYRVFGSKPGAYGAGLQGLIEAQNWTGDRDLARAYINWSCYAYSRNSEGRAAPEAFEQRLGQMQIVLHNQDNREHDLLDSDDYYQFQGGLTVAVRAVRGKNPQTYFGDNSIPANPRIRQLKEEIAKVYRSRVVNPKWIAGVMRHGYKGAFEMAATVDYLFAYDATANCVEDYMYQGIAEAYLFDPAVQDFVQQKNPWALRDMAERLIEAKQRGLWQVTPEIIDKLRAIAHQAEGAIEEKS